MHLRWVELKFPKADQVISLEEIKNSFLVGNQVKLEYVKHYDREKEIPETIYLVYKIPYVEHTLFDAFTGAKLNHSGDAIKDRTTPEYTDVKGHWAEEDIMLLNQYRLLPFADSEFKPDQAITQAELMQILVKLDNPWYDQPGIDTVYQHSARRSLIKQEDKAPNGPVLREGLAFMLVRILGYEDVSKLDIFKLEFKDAHKISADSRGSVAIISGFGFMKGDPEGNIMPDKKTTRAEAVSVLARMLRR
ncbi:MAG: S-layer homology domain-containing protein [Clostridia bacterium]|nr:S-layer homology domain-containing protein [Clostridia bacterium]